MKKGFQVPILAGLSAAMFIVFGVVSPAHAYLDPGAGSLILQGIIAGVAAAGVAVKIYWHRLLSIMGFRKDDDSDKN